MSDSWIKRAENIVTGPRAKDYGSVAENFKNIASLWSVVLGVEVTAHQVALCMIQLKVGRLLSSPGHEDSWIDIAGYVACAEQLKEPSND